MAIDLIQKYRKKLTKPEIRVWCHPKSGASDFYYTFVTLKDAECFIRTSKSKKFETEEMPLIAYGGFEMMLEDFKQEYPKVAKELLC